MRKIFPLLSLSTFILFSSCDSVQQVASTLGTTLNTGTTTTASGTTPSNTEMTSGLKQALSNGLTTAVNSLSATDGFWSNTAVKILMPTEVQKVEKTLRSVGMGSLCDKFLLSMNRAAESAVKEAAPVFVNSLSKLTITDAYNILLSGQQDAATSFFKRTTSSELTTKFSPIIQSALGTHKVNTYWSQLTTAYNALPIATSKVSTDLNAYVTQKAIDGLFVEVASQELKIRNNLSGSRNSSILQSVFGWVDSQK